MVSGNPLIGPMGNTGAPGGPNPFTGSPPPGGMNAGLAPLTGWAGQQNFNPQMLQDMIYDNPWFILPNLYPGLHPSSPGYQSLRDIGADPLALYNILQGQSRSLAGADTAPGDYTNWLANMYQQIGTPGGQYFSMPDMLNAIFSQDQDQPGNTSLWDIMAAGDASTQIRTLFNLLREVSNVGMNPLAARGYQAAVARAGDLYGNQLLGADPASNPPMLHEWLRQNYPSLAGRGGTGGAPRSGPGV